jgi:flagellar basal body-associated protein FliL
MEQNNIPVTPPQGPTQPTGTFTQQPAPTPENSSKFVIWIITGLVIIILVVGGIYLYLSNKQAVTTPSTTPAPVVQENLEDELNAVEIGDPDADFTAIDQDLQNL